MKPEVRFACRFIVSALLIWAGISLAVGGQWSVATVAEVPTGTIPGLTPPPTDACWRYPDNQVTCTPGPALTTSLTGTALPTWSPSPTHTLSVTWTPSPTWTEAGQTDTPTPYTLTPTATASFTESPTVSGTVTATPTGTLSLTPAPAIPLFLPILRRQSP